MERSREGVKCSQRSVHSAVLLSISAMSFFFFNEQRIPTKVHITNRSFPKNEPLAQLVSGSAGMIN